MIDFLRRLALMLGIASTILCLPQAHAQVAAGLVDSFSSLHSSSDQARQRNTAAARGDAPEQSASDHSDGLLVEEDNSGGEEGFLKNGPLSIFQNLSSIANPILRSLAPLPSLARAPFIHRARTRLEPEALDRVEVGNFSKDYNASESQEIVSRQPVRIVSWNIERGLQYEKILEILQTELRADIFILQEVDRDARRTDFRDVARSLAAELGMYFAYGIEFQELIQGKSGQPALHGQATLSRFPIVSARVLRFETQPKDWSEDWFQTREGGRMALVTKIAMPVGDLLVYNAHLESRGNDEGRSRQMQEMLADFLSTNPAASLLIAGDLNTGRGLDSPVFGVAREKGLQLISFSEALSDKQAKKQKDWILAASVGTSDATLHEQIVASDHKPVSARVWLDF